MVINKQNHHAQFVMETIVHGCGLVDNFRIRMFKKGGKFLRLGGCVFGVRGIFIKGGLSSRSKPCNIALLHDTHTKQQEKELKPNVSKRVCISL